MKEVKTERKRIAWVDVLKLMGVLLVYIGHLGPNTGRLYPFAWLFHISLLFFCSGYLLNESDSFYDAFRKKTVHILVPYYVFLLLCLGKQILLEPIGKRELLIFLINGALGTKALQFAQPLWFLPALFSLSLIAKLLHTAIPNRLIRLALSIVVSGAAGRYLSGYEQIPFCLNYALFFLAYFEMGSFLRSSPDKVRRIFKYAGIGFVIFSAFIYVRQAPLLPPVKSWVVLYICGLVNNVGLILGFVYAAKAVSGCRMLAEMGKETLYLFGNEILVKTVFSYFMPMLGLSSDVFGEMEPILFCAVMLLFVYKILVPVEKPVIDRLERAADRMFDRKKNET